MVGNGQITPRVGPPVHIPLANGPNAVLPRVVNLIAILDAPPVLDGLNTQEVMRVNRAFGARNLGLLSRDVLQVPKQLFMDLCPKPFLIPGNQELFDGFVRHNQSAFFREM